VVFFFPPFPPGPPSPVRRGVSLPPPSLREGWPFLFPLCPPPFTEERRRFLLLFGGAPSSFSVLSFTDGYNLGLFFRSFFLQSRTEARSFFFFSPFFLSYRRYEIHNCESFFVLFSFVFTFFPLNAGEEALRPSPFGLLLFFFSSAERRDCSILSFPSPSCLLVIIKGDARSFRPLPWGTSELEWEQAFLFLTPGGLCWEDRFFFRLFPSFPFCLKNPVRKQRGPRPPRVPSPFFLGSFPPLPLPLLFVEFSRVERAFPFFLFLLVRGPRCFFLLLPPPPSREGEGPRLPFPVFPPSNPSLKQAKSLPPPQPPPPG